MASRGVQSWRAFDVDPPASLVGDCPELERVYHAAGMGLLARLTHPDSGRLHLLYG